MGSVHLGRMLGPLGFSKVVAIKQLHGSLAKDPDNVTMFLDEARLVARLQHPNIVSMLDVVVEEGELFLVMEYVKGAPLSALLERAAASTVPCAPRVAAAIISGVLQGLHHAHETKNSRGELLRLVHRDVSPQNIMVGIDGVARVLDFGIAKAAGRVHQTKEGLIKGKVPYMPPEALEGRALDRRADVYAAGVVLWETFAGRRLYTGAIDQTLFARILTARVPLVSEERSGLERYDEVVLRALHRDLNARYASAHEMLLALEQCGPIATASEVAEWVQPLASSLLQERAALVHEIETDAGAALVPEPPPIARSEPPPAPAKSGVPRGALAGLVGLVGLVLLVGLLTIWTRQRKTAVSPASPSVTSLASAESSASEQPSTNPEPSAAPALLAPNPETKRAATPARTKKDCDPPYVLDGAGHRRYKIECVRGN
jgi:eukaryotic-like serine/threonine-protein kinase